MKAFLMAILGVALCLASGCSTPQLPAIDAGRFVYHRTDPFGGTRIEAINVATIGEYVTADSVTWVTIYPSASVSITAEKYRRKK